jgi:Zn-dependent protease with chaperone function
MTYLFVLLLVCLQVELANFRLQTLEVFLIVCGITALLMAVASCQKFRQLRAGGRVIAEDLGGEPLDPHTRDRRQRRLLNIVSEMAIASSVPAPTVYVLPKQPGINAFAAGLTFEDAVVAVTQGCLQRLNRDQLQGVIAHEFSHILNGDMRLNMRLVGVLHGVLGITLLAEALLQTAHELSTTTNDQRDAVTELLMALVLTLAGILLWPVGLIGTLFGTLVMSATSRQREFLADAYAVEFTRNPEGIAGALKVLAGCDAGSRVRSSKAIEASHFFFAPGCAWMSQLLATHPLLAERIRRLDPQWDGVPLFEDVDPLDQQEGESAGLMALAGGAGVGGTTHVGEHSDLAREQRANEAGAEAPSWSAAADSGREAYAQVLGTLAPAWLELADDAEGCQLVVLALWLIATGAGQEGVGNLNESDRRIVARLIEQLDPLDSAQQMLLFDRAIERIAGVSAAERNEFQARVEPLRSTSDRDDVAAWSMGWQVRRCLGESSKTTRPRYGKIAQVAGACDVLLSMACHCGTNHDAMAGYAFQRAVVHLQLAETEFWSRDDLTGERLDAAVELVAELAPRPRQQLLLAVERCLSADHGLTVAEALFIRGLCAALQVPTPAWLPGHLIGSGR